MDKDIIDIICQYFSRKPIEKAWVFGSFSRGEQRPDSDIDILITFVPNTKMGLQFFGMIDDLEKLLNRSVDLVVEGDLLPFAAKSANRDKMKINFTTIINFYINKFQIPTPTLRGVAKRPLILADMTFLTRLRSSEIPPLIVLAA